jgi:hypothetical protein
MAGAGKLHFEFACSIARKRSEKSLSDGFGELMKHFRGIQKTVGWGLSECSKTLVRYYH